MKTKLSKDFSFTQSNLQTYLNCRYKFYLRYVEQLAWPAQSTLDEIQFEIDRNAGIRFHQLLHQYFLGFDQELLKQMAQNDPDKRVYSWFLSFMSSPYANLQGKLNSEKAIAISINDKRYLAKFDLLQQIGDQYTIYDWKTSKKVPNRKMLLDTIQTKLYPLLLSEALNPSFPLTFVYWEAIQPEEPYIFIFNLNDIKHHRLSIDSLTDEIISLEEKDYHKTDHLKKCKICEYRSFCKRGVQAAGMHELEDAEMFDLNTVWEEDYADISNADLV